MIQEQPVKIAYWAYNFAPDWEAASMEVNTLLTEFGESYDTRLITQNTNSKKVSIFGKNKRLPLPFSLIAVPFFPRLADSVQINHIFSSPAEPILLSRIGSKNTVLTITKDSETLKGLEKNIRHLKKLRYIVVESEWHQELLRQAGLNKQAIKLIYPGVKVKAYQAAPLPFKILFATSPFHEDHFLSRGIYLILRVAEMLPEVRFIFTWRETAYAKLRSLIDNAGLSNVEVINGFIPDMDKVYQSVHATILPGLTSGSLKPAPHSALNSLAHGKPILISRPSSIASLVEREQCGVVFEPSVDCLCRSITYLREYYDRYQKNCHSTIQEYFSETFFIEGYRKIYEAMLNGAAPA